MRKEDCDRIIVETNAKMEKVIQWYLANQEWLDKEEFHAPMESGLIVLQEESIEVTFETKSDTAVEIAVYPQGVDRPAVTFDYNPKEQSYSNYRYPQHLSEGRRRILALTMKYDRTDYKESIKYHSLMMFAVHYTDIVKVDESQSKARTKKEVKRLRRSTNRPVPLVRKTYMIDDFQSEKLRLPGEKRGYTKPEHEVSVKGFFRTSKNGKRSWIKPHTRYRNKGNKKGKDYKI